MTAIVLATGVSRALSHDTIYSLKLRRRGIDLDENPTTSPFAGLTVAAVMEPPPEALNEMMPLTTAADILAASRHGVLPVLATDGSYLGTATARAAAEALADGTHSTVGAITHQPHQVTTDTDAARALDALVAADEAGLPVLDPTRTHLAGWLTHQSVLAALHRIPDQENSSSAT